jgi:hypothetical protein
LLNERALAVIRSFDGEHRQIAKSRVSNEEVGDLNWRAMLDRVFMHDAAPASDVIEGCDEIACIGRALGSLSRKYAADIDRVRVETDR